MGYRGKIREQNRARDLRAEGWTYKEICAEIGVSRSSVSLWVRDVEIDEQATWAALARATYENGNFGPRAKRPHRQQKAKEAQIAQLQEEGLRRIGRLTEKEFLVAGAALYAGEGSKTLGEVRFANTDPRMLLFYATWWREIDESRLRLRLYLHQGLDLDAASGFWSNLLAIPRSQMSKPYRAVPDRSIRRSKHPMGCPAVAYRAATTLRSIMGLVDALLSSSMPFRGSSTGGAGDC